jgi:hypothetical protein
VGDAHVSRFRELLLYTHRAALGGIAALWLLSLVLPAIEISGTALDGVDVLRRGWQAAREGVLAWYANPLFVIALLLAAAGRARSAGVLAGIGLLFGLTSLALEDVARASGAARVSVSLRLGFYLWLGAHGALTCWAWARVAAEHASACAHKPRRVRDIRD